MNRCDDRAGHLFATDFFEEMRSHCIRTTDKVNAACSREGALGQKMFVADKRTSEDTVEFMNDPGY
jgi:hypothetical protein